MFVPSNQQIPNPSNQPQRQQQFGKTNFLTATLNQQRGKNGSQSLPGLGNINHGLQSPALNSPFQANNQNFQQQNGGYLFGQSLGRGLGALLTPLGQNGSSNALADAFNYQPFGGGGWGSGS